MTNLARFLNNDLSLWSEPFDLMFKNFFETDSFFSPVLQSKFNYPVDIYENENDVTIEVAVVGLNKDDIKIDIEDGNILKVSYKKEEETEDKEGCKFLHRGIAKRAFNLGWKISDDSFKLEDAKANMEDGLLSIVIPKVEPKPKIYKTIEISGSNKKQLKK